jgi:hypothetical protein
MFAAVVVPLLLATLPQAPATKPQAATIAWQRNLADALATQQATGLPLLLVVNMDGEVFNERFANDVYRDPEFIALTAGYVCVVAAPERHTPFDYDSFGNRVPCPRFGGCTCSEHILIEPLLFERFFNGRRNAPRHVGVAPDGKVLFDRYLDDSMQTAIEAIRKHRTAGKDAPGASQEVGELLRRRDATARSCLERLYRDGDAASRQRLLAAAGDADNLPFDLLRLGLRAADDATFTAAAHALAKVATGDARIDLEDALARIAPAAASPLLAKLGQLGASDPATARLAAHLESALESDPEALSPTWRAPWAKPAFDGSDRQTIEAELDRCEARLRQAADDAKARLCLGTAQLALGRWLAAHGERGPEMWFEDARRSAAKLSHASVAAPALALAAAAAWFGGDTAGAAAAVPPALAAPSAEAPIDGWLAATFLEVVLPQWAQLAYGRLEGSPTALVNVELARTRAVLALLAERGGTAETGPLAGIGLLEFCGLRQPARLATERLLAQFPASTAAHERWRNRLRIDLGAEATMAAYERHVAAAADRPTAEWFAGLAAFLVAEQYEREQRGDDAAAARASTIAHFERSATANPDYADSANHYLVLALAGGVERKFAANDLAGAVDDLVKAHALRPASLDETDGLQQKPRAIGQRLRRALLARGETELANRLQEFAP